jgi:hypothetical protein
MSWEPGLFKIKKPTIPPTPTIPAFDYIVDIYSDKVVVTNPDGTTTQLSTIADLNNWLRNITGKRIRVNANVDVYDDLVFTPNEYWIFGEWIHGNVYLLSGKHTIISFTRLGDQSYRAFVSNYDPQTNTYTDVSGLKLYSIYAELDIHGTSDMVLRDILIYVEQTYVSYIKYIVGDVYMRGGYINFTGVTLRNAHIDASVLELSNVASSGGTGTWFIKTLNAFISGAVDASNTGFAALYLRVSALISVGANSSAMINLPAINHPTLLYRVVSVGVRKGTLPGCVYVDPLPSGVTWYFDDVNRRIVINNATTGSYDIDVVCEITTIFAVVV